MAFKKAIVSAGCCLILFSPATRADESLTLDDLWTDTKLYFTSPLRWDSQDWLYFGGAVAAVGAAHAFDGTARRHFAPANLPLDGKDTHATRDAVPAAAIVIGTWLYAGFSEQPAGRQEAYTMLEAAGFTTITAEAVKYAAGRARPNQTTNANDWRAGGSSFPSLHSSAAFAIGTVFAESGSDDYRWVRRIIGYGMAGATSYIRVKDSVHWLSDTVAGGAIGISTGAFTLNRRETRLQRNLDISVLPAAGGGVMLGFNYTMP